jgi:cell division protein FtsB
VAVLAISYLGSVRGYFGQRHELTRQQATLRSMVDQREAIRAQLRQLANPAVVVARARELGYVMPGERPLRVTGLERGPAQQPPQHDGGGLWSWLPDIF